MTKPYALIVDDNAELCLMISRALEMRQIASDSCGTMEEAQARLDTARIGAAVVDLKIPRRPGEAPHETTGVELARWIRNNYPGCRIIFITGGSAGDHGHLAYTVIEKGSKFDLVRLVREVEDLIFKVDIVDRLDRQDGVLEQILKGQKSSAKWMKWLAGIISVITPLLVTIVQSVQGVHP